MIPTLQTPSNTWSGPTPNPGVNGQSRVTDFYGGMTSGPFAYSTFPHTVNPYLPYGTMPGYGQPVVDPIHGIPQVPFTNYCPTPIGSIPGYGQWPIVGTPFVSPFNFAGIPTFNPPTFGFNPFVGQPFGNVIPNYPTLPYGQFPIAQPFAPMFGGIPTGQPYGLNALPYGRTFTTLGIPSVQPIIGGYPHVWNMPVPNPIGAFPGYPTPFVNTLNPIVGHPFIANPFINPWAMNPWRVSGAVNPWSIPTGIDPITASCLGVGTQVGSFPFSGFGGGISSGLGLPGFSETSLNNPFITQSIYSSIAGGLSFHPFINRPIWNTPITNPFCTPSFGGQTTPFGLNPISHYLCNVNPALCGLGGPWGSAFTGCC